MVYKTKNRPAYEQSRGFKHILLTSSSPPVVLQLEWVQRGEMTGIDFLSTPSEAGLIRLISLGFHARSCRHPSHRTGLQRGGLPLVPSRSTTGTGSRCPFLQAAPARWGGGVERRRRGVWPVVWDTGGGPFSVSSEFEAGVSWLRSNGRQKLCLTFR